MKKSHLYPVFALLALAPAVLFATDQARNCGCACCQGKETCCCHTAKAADPKPDEAKRYQLHGLVLEVDTGHTTLLVRHEAIPGLMPAMTMRFKVADATFKDVAKGATITATLVVRTAGYHLENVQPAAR